MARVYRPTYSAKIPVGAEIIERDGKKLARYKRNGRTETAPLTRDGLKMLVESRAWAIEYVDSEGRPRRKSAFTDRRATEQMAAALEATVCRAKAGIVTDDDAQRSKAASEPIETHVQNYTTFLRAGNVSAWYLRETERRLRRVLTDCAFKRLSDIRRESVERWKVNREREGMAPGTLRTYLGSILAFVNWARQTAPPLLVSNPLAGLAMPDSSDIRRKRRALTEDELVKLLDAARRRPLADAMTIRLGKRAGQAVAKLTDEARETLERLGKERALIYKTLVLTGLRRGELAGLTWADFTLDGPTAWVEVSASLAKNGKSETLPLRADLAQELRAWRAESGKPASAAPVFTVPKALHRIMDRDLVLAGIARRVKGDDGKWRIEKLDEEGCTIDVHALRHCTASFLAKSGVAPRTAQKLMRHSRIELTMGAYTDTRLLDLV